LRRRVVAPARAGDASSVVRRRAGPRTPCRRGDIAGPALRSWRTQPASRCETAAALAPGEAGLVVAYAEDWGAQGRGNRNAAPAAFVHALCIGAAVIAALRRFTPEGLAKGADRAPAGQAMKSPSHAQHVHDRPPAKPESSPAERRSFAFLAPPPSRGFDGLTFDRQSNFGRGGFRQGKAAPVALARREQGPGLTVSPPFSPHGSVDGRCRPSGLRAHVCPRGSRGLHQPSIASARQAQGSPAPGGISVTRSLPAAPDDALACLRHLFPALPQ
jgi:hypothetical protein